MVGAVDEFVEIVDVGVVVLVMMVFEGLLRSEYGASAPWRRADLAA